MKTLTQLFDEVIEDIFRSFTPEHRKHLNLMFRRKTKEWLQQKQEKEGRIEWYDGFDIEDLLEELLEETNL